jgi:hypothetical protein
MNRDGSFKKIKTGIPFDFLMVNREYVTSTLGVFIGVWLISSFVFERVPVGWAGATKTAETLPLPHFFRTIHQTLMVLGHTRWMPAS